MDPTQRYDTCPEYSSVMCLKLVLHSPSACFGFNRKLYKVCQVEHNAGAGAGPRTSGQGVEDEQQGIIEVTPTANG